MGYDGTAGSVVDSFLKFTIIEVVPSVLAVFSSRW